MIPVSQNVVVPNAAHAILGEAKDMVIATIRDFLNKHLQ
jgi:hypothetical protein